MNSDNKEHFLLGKPVKVVNIGLKIFYASLTRQGVEIVQVQWKPPAGGDLRLAKILEKLV